MLRAVGLDRSSSLAYSVAIAGRWSRKRERMKKENDVTFVTSSSLPPPAARRLRHRAEAAPVAGPGRHRTGAVTAAALKPTAPAPHPPQHRTGADSGRAPPPRPAPLPASVTVPPLLPSPTPAAPPPLLRCHDRCPRIISLGASRGVDRACARSRPECNCFLAPA
jgi:hypothetical protein